MKKFFSFLLVMVFFVASSFSTMPAYASGDIEVGTGENFTLESDTVDSSQNIDYREDHSTKEEVSDATKHNQGLNQWVSDKSIELIESWDGYVDINVIETPSSVITIQNNKVSIDVIANIIGVNGGFWIESGKNYHTGGWLYQYMPPQIDAETIEHLKGAVAPGKPELVYWEESWYDKQSEWVGWTDYIASLDTHCKTDNANHDIIIPGYKLYDFNTFPERYEYINKTIQLYQENGYEEIELMHIVEYTVEDTSYNTIRQRKAVPFEGGDMYFWDLTCEEAPDDGLSRDNRSFTSQNSSFTFSLAYQGRYHCTASQLVEQSVCDAYTYNRCEYLVIASTGQIIWKNEVIAPNIDDNVYLANQNLYYLQTYNSATEMTLVTTLDAYITVKEEDHNNKTPGLWEDDYFTERIE